ncbi:MAG: amino acid permease [Myxococcales bacterium]|nr:amino acid permease [Myxococcales bacterium]
MAKPTRFSTFSGVYRPIVLTVLGAMLYLREGWLVGKTGLLGALLVIAAAYLITGTTALSVASIATNLRLRAGGAFAIISGALGLEAGGAIGVPLYLAQTVSSVMYLYAFSEGWGYLFPHHPTWLVVGLAYLGVGALMVTSAQLASRAQAVMLGVIVAAVLSAFAGWTTATPQAPTAIAQLGEWSVRETFGVFFPAATGIMVGVGMSGNLENPRRAIPRGTMAAWATTLVVYTLGAIWYATVVPQSELLENKLAMVDHALVGELVLFGLLSSTLMAALSSLVAAPRLLQAMAEHDVVPLSATLREVTANGEPRNASLATLALAGLALTAGSLDAIAPIITSFFVMTYLAINVVVFLEQSLGLVSWRPTYAIPTWVPALGALACVTGLVLSSPAGGLPEVAFVVGLYVWLSRRQKVDTPWETVQSGIAQTVAAWAALKSLQMRRSERSWKPDLLVPVSSVEEARAMASVSSALVHVRGSVKFIALEDDPELGAALGSIVGRLRDQERYASWHLMPEEMAGQGARLSINALQGAFMAPNLVLLSARHMEQEVLQTVVDHARRRRVGAIIAFDDLERPLRPCKQVTVWLSDRSPDWTLALHVANLDLPVLLAYLLTRPVEGAVRLATVLRDEVHRPKAASFMDDLIELGRLPNTTSHLLEGTLAERLADGPRADLHLFGLSPEVRLERMQAIHEAAGAPCLFVLDSGQESALA